MRQDAQMFIQLSQDQRLDGSKLLIRALQLMGIEQAEGYVAPTDPQIPANVIEGFLQRIGVPPDVFMQYLDQLHAAGQSNGQPESNGQPQPEPQGVPQ